MESSFNNREFEQYVKVNADQYRMIPSEKVWKGINGTLHTRRRWYGFGLAFLLLVTTVSVTWVMVSYPASKKQQPLTNIDTQVSVKELPAQKHIPATPASKDISDLLSFNKFSKQDDASIDEDDNITGDQTSDNTEVDLTFSHVADDKTGDFSLIVEAEKFPAVVSGKKGEANSLVTNAVTTISGLVDIVPADKKAKENKSIRLLSDTKIPGVNPVYHPLTIESVVNAYHRNKISKRLTWQLYLTPTVSYRKWSANKSYHGPSSPFSRASYPFSLSRDVNSEVVHKPDMGLEVGLSAKYPLTRNLKLTGGLQFNINRYDIKAFAYSGEQATINLNGGNGNNSVTAWTYYRNYNGYKSDWLKNFYFSVSAPVGAELRLFGNDKTNFGIGGALQPTYILKDRAFLISSDYKNYVEMPRLIRHLNLNTSFETFVSYLSRNGKSRWQIGPQVRYQVLSSFQKQYPVKENLFDFGLKIGLTFNH
jgi:hypothetical protein